MHISGGMHGRGDGTEGVARKAPGPEERLGIDSEAIDLLSEFIARKRAEPP